MYKDSPLSYVEEGKDVYITKDTMFILKFKSSKEEDLDEENQTESEDSAVINSSETDDIQNSQDKIIPVNSQNEAVEQQQNTIPLEDPEAVLNEVEQNSAKEQF